MKKHTSLNEYQVNALKTKQNPAEATKVHSIPYLGMIGEIGSLATVFKKKYRDGVSYSNFTKDGIEELGDILWYFSNICSSLNLKLEDIKSKIVQENIVRKDSLVIFTELSILVTDIEKMTNENGNKNEKLLIQFLSSLYAISTKLNVSMEEVAEHNLKKIKEMWVTENSPATFRDRDLANFEQLPRKTKIEIIQFKTNGKTSTLMRMDGFNIGDRLTDNSNDDDGYRFHDVFHWSYVAVMGWSPVVRSILNKKRKSTPKVDEVQDGARAKIIEEAIAIHVYNYARDHGFFASGGIDQSLIKAIKGLARGLEVEDALDWEWKKAILEGYRVFRQLKEIFSTDEIQKSVFIEIDSDKRSLRILD